MVMVRHLDHPHCQQVPEQQSQQEPAAASSPPALTLETVAALLDGATPLHCAALRGNPSLVGGHAG